MLKKTETPAEVKRPARKSKIQRLLINHLLEEGSIELTLPDGMKVEFGITQEDREGNLLKVEDYCWIIASQDQRTFSMDSYNLGLRYFEGKGKMVVEDEMFDETGCSVKLLDVI